MRPAVGDDIELTGVIVGSVILRVFKLNGIEKELVGVKLSGRILPSFGLAKGTENELAGSMESGKTRTSAKLVDLSPDGMDLLWLVNSSHRGSKLSGSTGRFIPGKSSSSTMKSITGAVMELIEGLSFICGKSGKSVNEVNFIKDNAPVGAGSKLFNFEMPLEVFATISCKSPQEKNTPAKKATKSLKKDFLKFR